MTMIPINSGLFIYGSTSSGF